MGPSSCLDTTCYARSSVPGEGSHAIPSNRHKIESCGARLYRWQRLHENRLGVRLATGSAYRWWPGRYANDDKSARLRCILDSPNGPCERRGVVCCLESHAQARLRLHLETARLSVARDLGRKP